MTLFLQIYVSLLAVGLGLLTIGLLMVVLALIVLWVLGWAQRGGRRLWGPQ